MSNDTNRKDHPIFNAILRDDIKAVKRIVNKGCNLNTTLINDSATPLMWAVCLGSKYNNQKIIETLIELGANIHQKISQKTNTALNLCAQYGSTETFDLFVLKMGDQFDINEKNKNSETFLMMAAQSNRPQMINCILKYKPKLNLKNKEGQNALQIAKNSNENDRGEVIELLEEVFLKAQIKRDKALLNKKIKNSLSETKKVTSKI